MFILSTRAKWWFSILNISPTKNETDIDNIIDSNIIFIERHTNFGLKIVKPKDMANIGDKRGATIIPAITRGRLSAIIPKEVIIEDKITIT